MPRKPKPVSAEQALANAKRAAPKVAKQLSATEVEMLAGPASTAPVGSIAGLRLLELQVVRAFNENAGVHTLIRTPLGDEVLAVLDRA